MSSQPYIAIRQSGIRESASTTLQQLSEKYGLADESFVGDYFEDESARLTLTGSLSDRTCFSFHELFTELCNLTNWHAVIDWDDLDETIDFPYKSLNRPPGINEPVLLWPED